MDGKCLKYINANLSIRGAEGYSCGGCVLFFSSVL